MGALSNQPTTKGNCCNQAWLLKNFFRCVSRRKLHLQLVESSFRAEAEIRQNYCFGSFFNSHRR